MTVIETQPYEGQKPGTSGLRKSTKTFLQPNYTENFVQCILDSVGPQLEGCTLVVGGDGRHFVKEAAKKIVQIAAANKVKHVIVGQNGIFSTPAVSCIIRKREALGGIVLTASHNPGGIDADFGIKFNTGNGGPAPDSVTNAIYELTKKISQYSLCPDINPNLEQLGTQTFDCEGRTFTVEVVDSVQDYLDFMKEIFDFDALRRLIKGSSKRPALRILVNCLHGVTGPYCQRILAEELGSSVGRHPQPGSAGRLRRRTSRPKPHLCQRARGHDVLGRLRLWRRIRRRWGPQHDSGEERVLRDSVGLAGRPGGQPGLHPLLPAHGRPGPGAQHAHGRCRGPGGREEGPGHVPRCPPAGSISATSWTRGSCPCAARRALVRAPTTYGRKTGSGPAWPGCP
uniref:phosphoglucomutase (alpha-D-glucose-1,6-bisphosphate-dependent) n=1 Tax=Ixodes ricinus TaxID=34613 RepID=V5H0V0_IXORI